MKMHINPARTEWNEIVARPAIGYDLLQEKVKKILRDVRINGDDALRKYTLEFDKVSLGAIKVVRKEIEEASRSVSPALKKAIETAAGNIERFHAKQLLSTEVIETMPGIKCWQKAVGIEKVGLYIPGGSAPLISTVLMLGIPAKLAGCKEIIMCTPPSRHRPGDPGVEIHPAILFAAELVGITNIFKAGGVQAIGAMAYGTETIPAVYKIFGPGNQYVNCAKQLVQLEGVAIDMPAGPSELCVLADETSDPCFVAADLLSQAEHGPDSQVMLICNSKNIADEVVSEISRQLMSLERKEIAGQALANSHIVVLPRIADSFDLVNEYAPEHLIIACKEAELIAGSIVNAGSVFIGNYSPESAGDYASGTNHTLPTNGFAKSYSGVGVDSFMKKITFQQLTKEGLQRIGDAVEEMAAAEGLGGHAKAVRVRG